MKDIVIDPDAPTAPWRQLADALMAAIRSGELAEGRPIPSRRTLHEMTGLANPTIDKAIRLLKDEGLLELGRGRGLFVKKPD